MEMHLLPIWHSVYLGVVFAIPVSEPRISTGSLVHSIPLLPRGKILSSSVPTICGFRRTTVMGEVVQYLMHSQWGICGVQYVVAEVSDHNVRE